MQGKTERSHLVGCTEGPAKVKQAKDSYFFKTALTFQNAIMEEWPGITIASLYYSKAGKLY